ncbi:MAG: type II 3-dehydroquinate dehydratase [Pseudomonadota bacterium]|jgi:3-dehydroquinate dehydratase-2|nr:type II 3-dehydroquinate dehydratase [SAR116 cluster bacterium]MEC7439419.1 type II 3-dehydroquinate dehydratase [Pseudomonadota bacterium]MEC8109771.1 type II 3-dehydroquinate dehydratase [Pseudomonadota bacterium]MEC8216389.1 type II 3-dehydroquinate dehydratase [Pseudomonadota bacterium]MED5351320.1 type II 3-dehydroquinate dehydratase [Pseudomonadota bacterium]|tara:strand:- start:158 stop:610 length:453 start_codon:yes stop_codon:yes gene_type:complete
MSETVNILAINGPNLNMLGTREPEIYGAETLADVEASCRAVCEGENVSLEWMQTNSEAEIVTAIQQAIGKAEWILINAAGLTHCSVPLRDALALFPGRKIEIHLSNIHKRESFRHHSMISAVVDGVVLGFGAMSYVMAVKGVIDMAREAE